MVNNIRFMEVINILKEKFSGIMDDLNFDKEFKHDILGSMINLMKVYFRDDDNDFIRGDKEVDRYILTSSIACFWISCKFHDDELVDVSDLEYLTTFGRKDIIRYERNILKTVDFNIYSYMLIT